MTSKSQIQLKALKKKATTNDYYTKKLMEGSLWGRIATGVKGLAWTSTKWLEKMVGQQ